MFGGEDSGSDGLGNSYPALWRPELSKVDEKRICEECFIPKTVKLRFDDEKLGVIIQSDAHEVCLYETMFHAGFRLPFSRVIRELLSHLNLAPNQIVPNTWRVFSACTVLWPLVLGMGNFVTYQNSSGYTESKKIQKLRVYTTFSLGEEDSSRWMKSIRVTMVGRVSISLPQASGSSITLKRRKVQEFLGKLPSPLLTLLRN
jgi:hypothetical protein